MRTSTTTETGIIGLCCFAGGLAAGVAMGILFAPNSGADTRDLISRKAGEGTDALRAKIGEGQEYLRSKGNEVLGQTKDFVERGKGAVQAAKEKFNETSA